MPALARSARPRMAPGLVAINRSRERRTEKSEHLVHAVSRLLVICPQMVVAESKVSISSL